MRMLLFATYVPRSIQITLRSLVYGISSLQKAADLPRKAADCVDGADNNTKNFKTWMVDSPQFSVSRPSILHPPPGTQRCLRKSLLHHTHMKQCCCQDIRAGHNIPIECLYGHQEGVLRFILLMLLVVKSFREKIQSSRPQCSVYDCGSNS